MNYYKINVQILVCAASSVEASEKFYDSMQKMIHSQKRIDWSLIGQDYTPTLITESEARRIFPGYYFSNSKNQYL